MVTLSVLLSSGQCINRVMRLVVWGGVGGYERCMTSWCMREHCLFLTVETLSLFSVRGMCCSTVCGVVPCVLFTLSTEVERWVVCSCTVSEIGGTHMMICTYHYRLDGPH